MNPTETMRFLTPVLRQKIDKAFSFMSDRLYVMTGFPDDPLTVFKGKSIFEGLEEDHVAEIKKMKMFGEIFLNQTGERA
jgi:hypothetical protein